MFGCLNYRVTFDCGHMIFVLVNVLPLNLWFSLKSQGVSYTVKNSALNAVFPITLRSQFPNLVQEKIVIRI